MAWRLRYYKKAHLAARLIECLMRLTRQYLQSLAWLHRLEIAINLDG